MSLFTLSNDERGKLERLGKQQSITSALKKLFLNTATKGTIPIDVQTLAAERIAIDIIQDAFRQLETIKPNTEVGEKRENLI